MLLWQVVRRNLHGIVCIVDGHVYVDVTCEQGFALQPLWNDISFLESCPAHRVPTRPGKPGKPWKNDMKPGKTWWLLKIHP